MTSNLPGCFPRSGFQFLFVAVIFVAVVFVCSWNNRDLAVPLPKAVHGIRTRNSSTPGGSGASKNDTLPVFWKPIALLSDSCSGSTVTYKTVEAVLEDQGYTPMKAHKELFHSERNKYYDSSKQDLELQLKRRATKSEIISETLRRYEAEARNKSQIFVFSAQGPMSFNESMPILEALQYKVIMQYRSKIVDRSACRIRDCFGTTKDAGYPVLASNGSRSDLCFERRSKKYTRVPTQAYVEDLSRYKIILREMKEKLISDREIFSAVESNNVPQPYETLFAFEYSDNEAVFQSSLRAWNLLLTDVGVPLSEEGLVGTLRRMQNTRPLPPPVSEAFYNWDQVEEELGPSWEQDWTVE